MTVNMRFRLGVVVGFGAGYYLGAMAGRERYEQINRLLRKAKQSEAFDTASEKAKAVVDLGVERAKDAVESTFSNENGDSGSQNPNGPAEAGPLATTPTGTPVTSTSSYSSSR
jgi:hypothetical protein